MEASEIKKQVCLVKLYVDSCSVLLLNIFKYSWDMNQNLCFLFFIANFAKGSCQ